MRLAFHNVDFDGPASVNGEIFDKIIEWHSHSPYVHVELVDDSSYPDTSATCYSAVPDAGVRWARRDITQAWFEIVPLPAFSPAQTAAIRTAMAKYLGQKYDWVGILGFALPWGAHDDNDKFCSEVVVLCLQAAGLLPGVKSFRTSPADLHAMIEKGIHI